MKKLVKIIFFIAAVTMVSVTKIYAQVSVGVSVGFAPPEIPVYVQPACPVDGYLWEPGYWAFDPDEGDYYWVPGVWVAPPEPGLYWTPCYWGYEGSAYLFHAGYWGPQVGFYGGINYGGGYFGLGFAGGAWSGSRFRYNTAVLNVNRTIIHNTYVDRTVIRRNTIVNNHVSYNGGHGGVMARPRPQEQRAMNERHIQPTRMQIAHQQAAVKNRSQFAKANHGRPSITSMRRVDPQRLTQHANTIANHASRQATRTNARQHAGRAQQAVRNNVNQRAARTQQVAHNNARAQQSARRNTQLAHNNAARQQQHMQAQHTQQHAYTRQQQQHRAPQPMQPRAYNQPQPRSNNQPHRMQPQRMQPQPRVPQPRSNPRPQQHQKQG